MHIYHENLLIVIRYHDGKGYANYNLKKILFSMESMGNYQMKKKDERRIFTQDVCVLV